MPVSDVDRAKRFYGSLGWRRDLDYTAGDDFRAVQFTPPGSGCSIIFGKNVTAAAPGSVEGLQMIVSDIQIARLTRRFEWESNQNISVKSAKRGAMLTSQPPLPA